MTDKETLDILNELVTTESGIGRNGEIAKKYGHEAAKTIAQAKDNPLTNKLAQTIYGTVELVNPLKDEARKDIRRGKREANINRISLSSSNKTADTKRVKEQKGYDKSNTESKFRTQKEMEEVRKKEQDEEPTTQSKNKPRARDFKSFKEYRKAMNDWRKNKKVTESSNDELLDYLSYTTEGMDVK